jgi:hypothetical protein
MSISALINPVSGKILSQYLPTQPPVILPKATVIKFQWSGQIIELSEPGIYMVDSGDFIDCRIDLTDYRATAENVGSYFVFLLSNNCTEEIPVACYLSDNSTYLLYLLPEHRNTWNVLWYGGATAFYTNLVHTWDE